MQAAQPKQTENVQEQQGAIGSRMEHYMALWNAHAIAEHSKLLTEDADLVNVVGMHVRGRPEIQKHHEQLHRTIFSKSVSRILELSVHSVDTATVLVHMHWEMKGAAKLPGWNVPEPRTGVMTLLWVKQAGEWQVRALHNTDAMPVPELPNS
jgi:uncharacterized protein (TIGR02246 family)